MAIGIFGLLEVMLLFVNAIAILNEDRFLARSTCPPRVFPTTLDLSYAFRYAPMGPVSPMDQEQSTNIKALLSLRPQSVGVVK